MRLRDKLRISKKAKTEGEKRSKSELLAMVGDRGPAIALRERTMSSKAERFENLATIN